MNWRNVKLIFHREMRDQLRDRRTLFTIAVLPLLMYPLLGMAFLQISNFSKESQSKVLIVGNENLPESCPLVTESGDIRGLDPQPDASLLKLELTPFDASWKELLTDRSTENAEEKSISQETRERIRKHLEENKYDCVAIIPEGFTLNPTDSSLPDIKVIARASNDKSRIAGVRLEAILDGYRRTIVTSNLMEKNITSAELQPFSITQIDLSSEVSKRAAIWSRILPFVVFIWALTGAFYPAIDLCAGEKERGTLETLLSSPASRNEIVWGKLFTVIAFSMSTSLLNLLSMSFTGLFVINSMAQMSGGAIQIGPPPFYTFGWLIVALIPLSALFSATSLAIASFARSSKEGQYYLMPILLISLPLMMLPLMPGAELRLGTSLIPISGLMLVLKALIENRFGEAMQFAAPVLGVTLCFCLLAIQWAVRQFNNEKVLFRESERVGLGSFVRSLVRERRAMPTFLEAVFCGILLLVIRFFSTLVAREPAGFGDFAYQTAVLHIGLIIGPVVLMAIVLTTNPRRALGFSRTRWIAIPFAILMAIGLHPIVTGFGEMVLWVYPMPENSAMQGLMERVIGGAPGFLAIILVFALLPAISEEIAFRGFILNGLRQGGDRWTAILISSLFFGATHGLLQQSIVAFFTGTIIGFVSFQAGSILPAICYHFTHNAFTVGLSQLQPSQIQSGGWAGYLFQVHADGSVSYTLLAFFILSAMGIGLFVWFHRYCNSTSHSLPPQKSPAGSPIAST